MIASGPDTGWTGILTYDSSFGATVSIDAGYLVPAGRVDAALDYAEEDGVVFPGFATTWTPRIREGLGRPITSVRVRAPVPAGIQAMSWTCQGAQGAACPPGGTNALDFSVPLPGFSELHIVFSGQVDVAAGANLSASASVQVAGPQIDALPDNNSAQLALRSDWLFRGGFQ